MFFSVSLHALGHFVESLTFKKKQLPPSFYRLVRKSFLEYGGVLGTLESAMG